VEERTTKRTHTGQTSWEKTAEAITNDGWWATSGQRTLTTLLRYACVCVMDNGQWLCGWACVRGSVSV